MKTSLVSFESQNIRKIWHEERWFFSIIDVVEALTVSDNARRYWSDLKIKLREEGCRLSCTKKSYNGNSSPLMEKNIGSTKKPITNY